MTIVIPHFKEYNDNSNSNETMNEAPASPRRSGRSFRRSGRLTQGCQSMVLNGTVLRGFSVGAYWV